MEHTYTRVNTEHTHTQDEPLQLRVFDYDAFSADDIIGTVYVHCNSLYEGMHDKSSSDNTQVCARRLFGRNLSFASLQTFCHLRDFVSFVSLLALCGRVMRQLMSLKQKPRQASLDQSFCVGVCVCVCA